MMDEENRCEGCEYYDADDGNCKAFVCDGLNCDSPLLYEEDKR